MTKSGKPKFITRREQRERSQAAIIEAATHLFAHYGFEGTSIGAVSEASGVSKPNILYYFKDKDDLWRGAVTDLFEKIDIAIQLEMNRSDGSNPTLREMVQTYFRVCRQYPAYVLLPMIEGINDSWRTRYLAEHHLKPHVEAFEQRVSMMTAAGEIPPVAAIHLQNLITGGAQLYLALAPIWRHAIDVDTTSAEFLKGYEDAMMAFFEQASKPDDCNGEPR